MTNQPSQGELIGNACCGVSDETIYTEDVEKAFRQLLEAFVCTASLGVSRWEFAVDISDLRSAGIRTNSLRYLICAGLVEHAQEITARVEEVRQFSFTSSLTFTDSSCFTLTAAGERAARLECAEGKERILMRLPRYRAG